MLTFIFAYAKETTKNLRRKREELGRPPQQTTNDFGSIEDEDVLAELNWNRFLEDASYYQPQCNFQVHLDCALAYNPQVSEQSERLMRSSYS